MNGAKCREVVSLISWLGLSEQVYVVHACVSTLQMKSYFSLSKLIAPLPKKFVQKYLHWVYYRSSLGITSICFIYRYHYTRFWLYCAINPKNFNIFTSHDPISVQPQFQSVYARVDPSLYKYNYAIHKRPFSTFIHIHVLMLPNHHSNSHHTREKHF